MFKGENFCKLAEKCDFHGETFADCSLVLQTDTKPPNLMEKTIANSHKTLKFTKVFSLESFPLYNSSPKPITGAAAKNSNTVNSLAFTMPSTYN